MSDSNPIPVGVVGCGRMGRLHARVYSQMPGVRLVAVCDADLDVAEQTARDYGAAHAFRTAGELAPHVRAATIATPTVFHLDAARTLLPAGVACLIEKPIAGTSAEAREIVALAQQHDVPVMVGHIERFNPVVRAMRELKVVPQFIEVVRISPLTFRSIDVGVVLDIMIHDIDIVLNLAASEPTKVDAAGVSVISGDANGAEDVCNARVTFANGCVANFTASRLSFKTERKLRVFSPEAYVSLDYGKKHGIFVKRTENLDALRETVRQIRAGEIEDLTQLNYGELVDVQELKVETEAPEPLRVELESFIASVRDGRPVEIPATDGLKAVELAERIVAAMPRKQL